MGMMSAAIFALATAAIVWVSRRSLLHPTSHGFYRFFAFESILILLILNVPHWFSHPLAPRQLVSWLLLAGSLAVLVPGVLTLLRSGKPQPTPEDSLLYKWENTELLVTTGIYRFVRHPMYASLLYLAWGALLKSVSTGALVLTGVATLALVATARAEEAEDVARFGQSYRDYMKHSRRFVPFLF